MDADFDTNAHITDDRKVVVRIAAAPGKTVAMSPPAGKFITSESAKRTGNDERKTTINL